MNNRERKRERYLKDPLPIRLGGLAADLARVASTARHQPVNPAVATMLEESQWFIEWTAADAEIEVAAELVDIQRQVALWRRAWSEAQKQSSQRALLSIQAQKWSDQVLAYSGLLDA